MAWLKFGGSTSFTDSHETTEVLLGNDTWFNQYEPRGEDRIAEVVLWLCHTMGLCCTVVGQYAMYRAGKLATRPKSMALYIARPQTWSPEFNMLMQETGTLQFELGGVEFVSVTSWAMPGRSVFYRIRHDGDKIILKISYVNCDIPWGPRANLDLTYNLWTTFDYYCANYAIVVLPSTTFGDKIVYVRHIEAEVGGATTRQCGQCVCTPNGSPLQYDVGCTKPEKCRCVLCCQQPPSLKSLASEIVFELCNREKLRLDDKNSCSPIGELELGFDSDYEDG